MGRKGWVAPGDGGLTEEGPGEDRNRGGGVQVGRAAEGESWQVHPGPRAQKGLLGFALDWDALHPNSESHPEPKEMVLPGPAGAAHGCVGGQGQGRRELAQPRPCGHSHKHPTNDRFNESFLTLGLSNLQKFSTLQFLKVDLIWVFYRSRSPATYSRDVQLFFSPLPFETISKPQWFPCLGECSATRNICKQLIFQMGDGHHRCRPFQNKH